MHTITRHRYGLAAAAVVAAIALSVTLLFAVIRGNNTNTSGHHSGEAPPAATAPSVASQGPRTDPFAVNPWAAATAAMLRYYEQHPQCAPPNPPTQTGC